ncbi:MAG: hypothetical protein M9924_07750 [Rhizobiaceae bacterium]|nr:hypothetical protein [Rhizobiaceae bacterium]
MDTTSVAAKLLPQPIDWDTIFAEVNSWRGASMHHFSAVEMAVTETLLALSTTIPAGPKARLRHLIGQRFEDLALALGPGGSFEEAGKPVFAELTNFREKHESFRNLLCHGVAKVTIERSGQWVIVIRTLSIRSRQPDRTTMVLEQREAEAKLAMLKRDGQNLSSKLGTFRKTVITY